jgi:AraC-like DNA-binding protein
MATKTGVDVYEEHTEVFRTAVADSFLVASRTRCETLGEGATIHARAQDSFSLVYMLDHLPRHHFWSDECRVHVPDLERRSLHIMDLRASGNARFASKFDTLNIAIPRTALSALAEQTGCRAPTDLRVPVAWTTRDPVVESLESGLLHAISAGPALDPMVGDHVMLAMLTHVAIRYGGMQKPSPRQLGELAPWQLDRAKELMASDLAAPMALAEVARHIRVSPSHFSRAFKASTGLAPSAWLLGLRLDRAKDLLRASDLPIADVAALCGFADQSHFTRTFSKSMGQAPGAWRRSYRRPGIAISPSPSIPIQQPQRSGKTR